MTRPERAAAPPVSDGADDESTSEGLAATADVCASDDAGGADEHANRALRTIEAVSS